ncbi:hypothetical protein [Shewanella mangrovisoli]|uniref:hypothetical protein n=1 Tax=Shewanella mangrovisoli TaxID=2864211 RepID=UPI0035B93AC8
MPKHLTSIILTSSILIIGCSSNTGTKVTFSDSTRLIYQGNSAAMMSMIGTMGIAIGVAIDEGIAKEVEANLEPQNGSKAILTNCLNFQSIQHPNSMLEEINIEQVLLIPKDNGFYITINGVAKSEGELVTFTEGKREWGQSAQLTTLKTDANLTVTLLDSACEGLWQSLLKNVTK